LRFADAVGSAGGSLRPTRQTERDQLAAELAEVYPQAERQLSDLMRRIEANDREIEWVNGALPRGKGGLLVAELVARRLEGFVRNGLDIPRFTRDPKLPAFEGNIHHRFAWPR
jgi:hypothetical protein